MDRAIHSVVEALTAYFRKQEDFEDSPFGPYATVTAKPTGENMTVVIGPDDDPGHWPDGVPPGPLIVVHLTSIIPTP